MNSNIMKDVTVTQEAVRLADYRGSARGFIVIHQDRWSYIASLEAVFFHANGDVTLIVVVPHGCRDSQDLSYWLLVASQRLEAELAAHRKDCRFSSHPELAECLGKTRPVKARGK